MRILIITVIGLALIIGMIGVGLAEVPRVITYQGFLAQTNGTPVPDGTYSIVFQIYSVPSGGLPLWSSWSQSVDVHDGMFSIQLGASPMPVLPANIAADSSRYLGVTVDADPEIVPRTRLTTSCYAFKAQSADTATYVRLDETYYSTGDNYGVYSNLYNSGPGITYGVWSEIEVPATSANAYAVCGVVAANTTTRTGLIAVADPITISSGYSYGLQSVGHGGYMAYGGYLSASNALVNYGSYCSAWGTGDLYGVYGTCKVSNGDYGGYFYGNLHATGTNTKGGGGFIIDHPLDPENRYLVHCDVESPEMKNVYDGIAVLDHNGKATVVLPNYFEALNREFRYQLTCLGSYAPVFIEQEINGNRFMIAGGKPEMKVSWQVTGIRKDAFAEEMKTSNEPYKTTEQRGQYLHPEVFGFGMEHSINKGNHTNNPETESTLLRK